MARALEWRQLLRRRRQRLFDCTVDGQSGPEREIQTDGVNLESDQAVPPFTRTV